MSAPMDYDEYKDFLDSIISMIDDLPVGCESLEGYYACDDIWDSWNRFKAQTELNNE